MRFHKNIPPLTLVISGLKVYFAIVIKMVLSLVNIISSPAITSLAGTIITTTTIR
jgi:hypothetical protein